MKDKLAKAKNRIPIELWLKARAEAILERKTVGDWVCEAIKEKLERRQK